MELESIHNPTGHFFPKVYQKENKIPTPSHRHAAPSAPWPWINTHDGELNAFFLHSIAFITCLAVDPVQLESRLPPVPPLCDHKSCNGCWKGYPQSRFPNWTKDQVSRSKIADAITNYCSDKPCIIYRADVRDDGFFENVDSVTADDRDRDATWNIMVHTQVCGSLVLYDVCPLCVTRHLYSVFFLPRNKILTISSLQRPPNIRVRAMFVQNLSGPVLQMLGTRWDVFDTNAFVEIHFAGTFGRYNIEPFFFSSSLNWIPSRFQEEIQHRQGDRECVTPQSLQVLDLSIQI